jgi:hypothetical protein
MAIIDLDSHLRDGWLLDEIYQLQDPFKQYTPKRIGDGQYFYSKFEHQLSPMRFSIIPKRTGAAMKSCVGNRAATIWNTG